jgi:hypothetical protein
MTERRLAKLTRKTSRAVVEKLGYRMYDPTMRWHREDSFVSIYNSSIPGIPDERCFVLHSIARALARVPGDITECGSRQGRSAWFILSSIGDLSSRAFRIFDSFAGLSDPSKHDERPGGASAWRRGDLATSEAALIRNLEPFQRSVHIYKGWIPSRFNEVSDRKFALVHVDVDLYEPTRASLEFFYERTVPRGMIVCDDYGSVYCPGARKAMDDFFADKPEPIIHLPTGQAIVTKL